MQQSRQLLTQKATTGRKHSCRRSTQSMDVQGLAISPYTVSGIRTTWLEEIRHEYAEPGGVLGEGIRKLMQLRGPTRYTASSGSWTPSGSR